MSELGEGPAQIRTEQQTGRAWICAQKDSEARLTPVDQRGEVSEKNKSVSRGAVRERERADGEGDMFPAGQRSGQSGLFSGGDRGYEITLQSLL